MQLNAASPPQGTPTVIPAPEMNGNQNAVTGITSTVFKPD